MTNFEYFKTFKDAVAGYEAETKDLVYNLIDHPHGTSAGRFVGWLYREHKTEPLNCPICGSVVELIEIGGIYIVHCKDKWHYSQIGLRTSKEDAITAHNRWCIDYRGCKYN